MGSKKSFKFIILFVIINLSLIPTVKSSVNDFSLSTPFTFDNATYSRVESTSILLVWFLFYGYLGSSSTDSFELNWQVMALPDQDWDVWFYLNIVNCAGPGSLSTPLNSGSLLQSSQNNLTTTSLSKDGLIIANNGSAVNPTQSYLSLLSLELHVSDYTNDSTFTALKYNHMLGINVNLTLNGNSLGIPSDLPNAYSKRAAYYMYESAKCEINPLEKTSTSLSINTGFFITTLIILTIFYAIKRKKFFS